MNRFNRLHYDIDVLASSGINRYFPHKRDYRYGTETLFFEKGLKVVASTNYSFCVCEQLKFDDALWHTWYSYPKDVQGNPQKMANYLLNTAFKDCDK